MIVKNVVKLSIVPIFLVCLGVLSYWHGESYDFSNADVGKGKISKLADGIQSGSVRLSDEQVVTLLKASRAVEVTGRNYIVAEIAVIKSLSELIVTCGFLQIGIIFILYKRNGKRGAE